MDMRGMKTAIRAINSDLAEQCHHSRARVGVAVAPETRGEQCRVVSVAILIGGRCSLCCGVESRALGYSSCDWWCAIDLSYLHLSIRKFSSVIRKQWCGWSYVCECFLATADGGHGKIPAMCAQCESDPRHRIQFFSSSHKIFPSLI